MDPKAIDRTLAALADPTRRGVVDVLRKGPRRAGELAAALSMTAPAMSRHLRVLRKTGLVEIEDDGTEEDARVRLYRLRPAPFSSLRRWLDEVESFWASELEAFKEHAERTRGEAPGMSALEPGAGDAARVTVSVALDPPVAFEVFTEEIDRWWRHGPAYRMAGRAVGRMVLEPKLDGRLFELVEGSSGPRTFVIGRVTVWEPPSRVVLEWQNQNFAPDEKTEVEVRFEAAGSGTRVTLEHRGWGALLPDHPARHGKVGADFARMIGMWWGQLLTSMREHVAAR